MAKEETFRRKDKIYFVQRFSNGRFMFLRHDLKAFKKEQRNFYHNIKHEERARAQNKRFSKKESARPLNKEIIKDKFYIGKDKSSGKKIYEYVTDKPARAHKGQLYAEFRFYKRVNGRLIHKDITGYSHNETLPKNRKRALKDALASAIRLCYFYPDYYDILSVSYIYYSQKDIKIKGEKPKYKRLRP